ncbi:MAG: NUDIX domain-containing protein [Acidimicrobiales bacterium]
MSGHHETAGFRGTGSTIVWSGRRLRVERRSFKSPQGEAFDREVVVHPGAVGVIAVDEQGMVTLVRQFRGPMGEVVLEMPAGTCDVQGEELEATAKRELAEEAGLEAAAMERLATLPVSPGVSNQTTTVFLATGLQSCETGREGPEERAMSTVKVPLDQVVSLVSTELIDAPTLAGVSLAIDALSRRR